MVNKKGQEMSVTTLILIVLGVVLLVLLILGFSMGWTNLWNKINIFQGGSTVDSMVQACKISASSDASASFCEFKLVTIDGVKQYVNCQDSDIASRLDKSLTCTTGDALTSAKNYCAKLYNVTLDPATGLIAQNGVAGTNAATLKADTKLYNGQTCLFLLTGKQGADAEAELTSKTKK